jgi:rRNA maturation RNase YbeY
MWIEKSIEKEKRIPGDINIIICSDDYLYEMNINYLKHDTFTDIITFDYSEENSVSGDLFISIERVRENAKKFSGRVENELHRVIIHGILHLCGYDDKTDEEKGKMRQKENDYLSERPEGMVLSA